MNPAQALLAEATSVVFVALIVICVRLAVRARSLPPALRWAVGSALVALVVTCWASNLAPRSNPRTGVTCIEEPLFGLDAASDLATPDCVGRNWTAVMVSLAVAGVFTLGAGVGARIAARKTGLAADPMR